MQGLPGLRELRRLLAASPGGPPSDKGASDGPCAAIPWAAPPLLGALNHVKIYEGARRPARGFKGKSGNYGDFVVFDLDSTGKLGLPTPWDSLGLPGTSQDFPGLPRTS